MGLFNKKKKEKNKEEINITIDNDDSLFLEQIDEEKKPLEKEKNKDEMITELIPVFKNISSKNNRIIQEYYICKILSRVGLKDFEFNLQVVMMDKHVNRLKKECFDLSRFINNIEAGLQFDETEIKKNYKKVIDLQAFQNGVFHQLSEINNNSYGHLKISTVTITLNKNNEELEMLYNNISNELKGFKSFEEAAEFIYFNSGDFIGNLVDSYVQYVKACNNDEYIDLYNKHYFLESDIVISMDVKEWIELYKKLKFVLKQMNNRENNLYINCNKLFNIFEAKYAILMMRAEQNKNRI